MSPWSTYRSIVSIQFPVFYALHVSTKQFIIWIHNFCLFCVSCDAIAQRHLWAIIDTSSSAVMNRCSYDRVHSNYTAHRIPTTPTCLCQRAPWATIRHGQPGLATNEFIFIQVGCSVPITEASSMGRLLYSSAHDKDKITTWSHSDHLIVPLSGHEILRICVGYRNNHLVRDHLCPRY